MPSKLHERAPRDEPAGRREPASIRVITRTISDEELLDRLRRADPEAAALLYDRFVSDVNRLIWRLLGADDEHDDLVQQVFCRLLGAARKVRDPALLGPFVLRVTVNTVRSELRKRAVRRRFFRVEEDLDRFEAVAPDLERALLLKRTFEILGAMPVNERLVLSLRYLDDRPLDEVASMSGTSLATVKRRLARARERFSALAASCSPIAERLDAESRRVP